MKRLIPILLAISFALGGCAAVEPSQGLDFSGLVVVRSDSGSGSGAVVARDESSYYVATAYHVVEADKYPAVEELSADTVATDPVRDIAILRVPDSGQNWRVLTLSDAKQGESVVAIGWSWHSDGEVRRLAYRGHVVSVHWDGQYHRLGAAISTSGYPGMSGGPILDSRGRCVGIMRGCVMVGNYLFDSTAIIAPAREIRALLGSIEDNKR